MSLLIGLAFGGLMFLGHETMHMAPWCAAEGSRSSASCASRRSCYRLDCGPSGTTGCTRQRQPDRHLSRHVPVARRVPGEPRSGSRPTTSRRAADAGAGWRASPSGSRYRAPRCCSPHASDRRFSPRDHRRALAETALLAALWIALAVAIGLVPFVFAYVLPLVIANAVVMSFILTNHALCPATDPTIRCSVSSRSRVPRWVEWLTLGFGYHVEHHLFPAASTRHARTIRAALLDGWPERYQSLPLGTALAQLFRTGRVYRDSTTLSTHAARRGDLARRSRRRTLDRGMRR